MDTSFRNGYFIEAQNYRSILLLCVDVNSDGLKASQQASRYSVRFPKENFDILWSWRSLTRLARLQKQYGLLSCQQHRKHGLHFNTLSFLYSYLF